MVLDQDLLGFYNKYQAIREHRRIEQEEFAQGVGGGKSQIITCLDHLAELLSFELWLAPTIAQTKAMGKEVDVTFIIIPPLDMATMYRSMYAFEYHLRVASAKQ